MRLAPRLFRTNVPRRSSDDSLARVVVLEDRQSEVCDEGLLRLVLDENIPWLDVAMNDAVFVRVVQRRAVSTIQRAAVSSGRRSWCRSNPRSPPSMYFDTT